MRILPDNFYGVEQAVIVAKGHVVQREFIDRFIDEARASGFIRAAIERAALAGVDVAPPRGK
jgi:polar amino acid transport system substrate-binding protein